MNRVNILTAHCVQGAEPLADVALPSVPVTVTYRSRTADQDAYNEASEDSHVMPLHDGRPCRDRFQLDKSGFELCTLDASISASWANGESVAKHVYPVAQKCIAQATGAFKVIAFDHILRDPNQKDIPFLGSPIARAHNDYSVRSGFTRARQLLEPYCKTTETLDNILKSRFAIINFWFPLETVTEMPLAMCEWNSVSPSDVRTIHFDYGHRTGETYTVHYNPAHRWVYYSQMQPNEAILLKTFDSSEDVARFAVHSAVPYRELGYPEKPRRSLEVRCLVFYEELPEDVASQFVAPHLLLGYSESRQVKMTVLPPSDKW